jgi:hypothetical protein
MRNVYTILVGKLEGQLAIRWDIHIKMDVREIACEDVN